ncbi:hypothetical protein [Belnapia rosea]|uniref:hypothetical protein n=1 Tax=Belnapia rosea TaxID=938405 RepID=UPI00088855B8|nr:hypothetical protein [Belnapia rosea]SDB21338.1 hypothetical protein SAMN02927895_00847 [Belnapia rosea]
MTDPFSNPWLPSTYAWIAMHRAPLAEVQRQQARLMVEVSRQAIRFWSGAWLFPTLGNKPTTAARMVALSLRVVEGGRR